MTRKDLSSHQPTPSQAPENPPFASTPKAIGPYKIESLLERGGMSVLYLGTHPETKEPVTIKALLPKFLSQPEVVKRFLNEAEIIAMADHPNIVKLYGHGEWEGGLYIAMEFIQGISLRQHLLQTPMSLKRSLEIILDIAYALCHLHTHGVIHRDLKPENILMTEAGQVKVIDFGISQLLTQKEEALSSLKRSFIGTPIYMSPEQRESPETVSYPSDIYSLGIIAYELILGKLSHGQIHISLMPKGLQKIMHKTLQYKPEDRYHDIVDFISDVTTYLHSAHVEKERKVTDHLSEFSENLKQAYSLLMPSHGPNWPPLEIGIVTNKSLTTITPFYDFFQTQPHTYGIVLGASQTKGAEGIFHTAYLKGLIRALYPHAKKPAELTFLLNQTLTKDQQQPPFSLSYLMLFPKSNELSFISCGSECLWLFSLHLNTLTKISSQNSHIGVDSLTKFIDISQPWQTGNLLLFCSFPQVSTDLQNFLFSENDLHQLLAEHAQSGPQKLAEHIQRRIRLFPEAKGLPYTIFCIQKISYSDL